MLRFNKEKLEVDSLDDKTMLNALMQGVRAEGPLMAKVGRKNIQKGYSSPVYEVDRGVHPPGGVGWDTPQGSNIGRIGQAREQEGLDCPQAKGREEPPKGGKEVRPIIQK
jgi:hypothetical protein